MSATDELRRMLDERGIYWWAGDDERKTLWELNGLTWEYSNFKNGDAWLGFLGACEQDITPEQAIAAMLNSTCETCPQMDNPDSFIRYLMGRKLIVLCKDCRFEIHNECSRPDEWVDELWFPVEPDGFCKWGERK